MVAMLKPGEFFCEGLLIGLPLRLATAKAVTKSEVMRVEKAEMIRVLHAEPTFGELFIARLL
jgi:CRP/FNR family transcriptional regulator, cyclic AMP receptor protein